MWGVIGVLAALDAILWSAVIVAALIVQPWRDRQAVR